MKLINGAELRKCPAGTLYQKYVHFPELSEMLKHRGIGGLVEKGRTVEEDTFLCRPLSGVMAVAATSLEDSIERFQRSKETGESMPMNLSGRCSGWYHADIDGNEHVMVWEPDDVELLIRRLQGLNELGKDGISDD